MINNDVFTENVVDRFNRSRGFLYNNREGIVNFIGMIFILFPVLVIFVATLKYWRVPRLIFSKAMSIYPLIILAVLVVIVSSFVIYHIDLRMRYNGNEIKTERMAWLYKAILKDYFNDFAKANFLNEGAVGGLVHEPKKKGSASVVIKDFRTVTNANQMLGGDCVGSRVIMLKGSCHVGSSVKTMSLTLKFNNNFSELTLQKYDIK